MRYFCNAFCITFLVLAVLALSVMAVYAAEPPALIDSDILDGAPSPAGGAFIDSESRTTDSTPPMEKDPEADPTPPDDEALLEAGGFPLLPSGTLEADATAIRTYIEWELFVFRPLVIAVLVIVIGCYLFKCMFFDI